MNGRGLMGTNSCCTSSYGLNVTTFLKLELALAGNVLPLCYVVQYYQINCMFDVVRFCQLTVCLLVIYVSAKRNESFMVVYISANEINVYVGVRFCQVSYMLRVDSPGYGKSPQL